MYATSWLAALLLLPLQVPPPSSGEESSRDLHSAYRKILQKEAASLSDLAERLARDGDAEAAEAVRARLRRASPPDGPSRFVPLPDVVARSAPGKPDAPSARIEPVLTRSANEFFELAQRAARSTPPRYALAGVCLRAVLERGPDYAETRRLLGYEPYQGGWARPFAVKQFRFGYIDHPVFGWVPGDWKPHLERGELPTPPSRSGKVRWLQAAEADRLRAGWSPPWQINTEHFRIDTNVPLAEAISFGRRLEAFHDLFMALMADVQGDNSPLARRFRDPRLVGEPRTAKPQPHLVYYFASKAEYVAHLTLRNVDRIEGSLGFYKPPKKGNERVPAYFFRDPNGELPVTANLYHEVSHQLLFETAGTNRYTQNLGNYWVFEGLGTYFETVEPQPDGSLEVGGRLGRRMEEAIRSLVDHGQTIPLDRFVGYDEATFSRDDPAIYLRYQQAMALTTFLMQWHDGAYRESFLDYVRDAFHGRLRGATGRKLDDRLDTPFTTLESQLLSFLKDAQRREGQPQAAAEPKPRPKPTSGGAIRTVPRQ
jgi:hypothetical protein